MAKTRAPPHQGKAAAAPAKRKAVRKSSTATRAPAKRSATARAGARPTQKRTRAAPAAPPSEQVPRNTRRTLVGRPARTRAALTRSPHDRDMAEVSEVPVGMEHGDGVDETAVELTQPYERRFTFPEQVAFLADAEHALLRRCCRLLPALTTQACSRAALTAITEYGTSPPGSPTLGPTTAPEAPHTELPLKSEEHEVVYRTVLNTVVASCALGHRSCQAIWGPRGSGKHRILRLVAQTCEAQANTLVLQLDGALLNSDEDAIREIAAQMLAFLRAPQSAAVRAVDWSLRTGTFDFGRLFHFERALSSEHAGRGEYRGAGVQGARLRPTARGPTAAAARAAPTDAEGDSEEGEGEDDDDVMGAAPLITSTTANLTGGAAGALPPLQRALLLLKHHHVNIVVCIRQADRFGIWCDQLLYVLSGLMHESDGQGGGMALLLTSAAPDLRSMEKRLSSRLTGETRFVPLLSWTPRRILRGLLHVAGEWCACRIALCRSGGGGGGDGLSPDWQRRVEALRQLLPATLPLEGDEAVPGATPAPVPAPVDSTVGISASTMDHRGRLHEDEERDPAPSLYVHPTLLEEAMAALCIDLQHQLEAATRTERHRRAGGESAAVVSGKDGDATDTGPSTLVQRIQEANASLAGTGATAEVVMAAVAQSLCKACAGTLDCQSLRRKRGLIAWLDGRQGRERAWPWRQASRELFCGGHDTALARISSPVGRRKAAPAAWHRWMAVLASLPNTLDDHKGDGGVASHGASPRLPIRPPAPPELYDLLEGGELVRLGYASREAIQLLFHILVQHDAGLRGGRSIADLLEDVTSALGTRAAAVVDKSAYRLAIRQLCRWKLLHVADDTELVTLCGSGRRLREFLQVVLAHQGDWCESGVLGLDAREIMRMRSLV